jgi:two-component system chemotaxis sensor kinase CheA
VNDRFLSLFFEEARELIQALEAGLMDLESRQGDREHLDRTFRAAHTLKGAAGMVGLKPIAQFTHKVEAVLDDIRAGRMAVTREAITILLRAKDHLGAALDEAVAGRTTEAPPELEEALVELKEGRTPPAPERAPEPTPAGSLPVSTPDRTPEPPTVAGEPRVPAAGPLHRYRISFRPRPSLLRNGIDPLGFLDELRELGDAHVTAHVDAVPPLEELNPTDCLLAWTVDLLTNAGRAELEEVFLFLDDPGQVTIEEIEIETETAIDEPVVAPASPVVTPKEPDPTRPPPAEPARPRLVSSVPRVRVDAAQLDDLVGMAGELAVLTDSLQGLADLVGSGPFAATIEALERLGRRLRDATLELRMVPIEELFVRFPRVVRDLAEKTGKRIDFRMEGEETLLDRTIVERLADPMIHLIRNAVDHGLETPEERLARGKPPTGRITIAAGHEGDRVAIRLIDDGRGLDRAKILRKGIALGLLPPDTSPEDPRVGNVIFEAGFSTSDQVGELSGRGVGLDVVRDTIRGLRGTVTLQSIPGKGTTFLIRLPLTLAMIDGLLVEVEGDRYVVPIGQVDECVSLAPEATVSTMGRRAAVVREELVPIVSLDGTFRTSVEPNAARRELLLTRYAEQRVGVAVDRLLGRVQAVIQPLDDGLDRLGRFSGATILGDGSVSLILDLMTLVAETRAADLTMIPSLTP